MIHTHMPEHTQNESLGSTLVGEMFHCSGTQPTYSALEHSFLHSFLLLSATLFLFQAFLMRPLSTSHFPLAFRSSLSLTGIYVHLAHTSFWVTKKPSKLPSRKWKIKGKPSLPTNKDRSPPPPMHALSHPLLYLVTDDAWWLHYANSCLILSAR